MSNINELLVLRSLEVFERGRIFTLLAGTWGWRARFFAPLNMLGCDAKPKGASAIQWRSSTAEVPEAHYAVSCWSVD